MGRRRITGEDTATKPSSVPILSIVPNPRNRVLGRDERDYSKEALAELTASIEAVGILQSIGVMRYEVYLQHYPEHEEEIGTHDWVALVGNRRLKAAQFAGLDTVPVHVLDHLGREGQLDDAVLIENIQRLNYAPMREAAALQELLNRHGTQHEVAKRIGKTQGYVSQRLKLLKLAPELQAAVAHGSLRVEDARSLAGLPVTDQAAAWDRLKTRREQADDDQADYGVITAGRKVKESGSTKPPSKASKPAKTDYDVIPAGQAVPVPTAPVITLGPPEQIVEQLREHLSSEDIEKLTTLLMDLLPASR
jgi:ParB family transcriptional regulator, chromosome partitioning protein